MSLSPPTAVSLSFSDFDFSVDKQLCFSFSTLPPYGIDCYRKSPVKNIACHSLSHTERGKKERHFVETRREAEWECVLEVFTCVCVCVCVCMCVCVCVCVCECRIFWVTKRVWKSVWKRQNQWDRDTDWTYGKEMMVFRFTLSIYLSVCLSVYLSIHLFIIDLSIIYLSTYIRAIYW